MRLLDPRRFQVFEDHLRKVGRRLIAIESLAPALGGSDDVNQFVVPINSKRPVRGEAFDREGTSDADAVLVDVRLVVEVFIVRIRRNRRVDLPLARDARFPPCRVQLIASLFLQGSNGRSGRLSEV